MRSALGSMFYKHYDLSITFVNELSSTIEGVNEKFRLAQEWDKVIYDDYVGSLTKASTRGTIKSHTSLLFTLVFVLGAVGALMFILPKAKLEPAGIKNNGIFKDVLNSRGWIGILIGTLLILFYIIIYFYDAYITNWIILVEPLKKLIYPEGESSQWFLYGFLYTFAVLVMGVRMIDQIQA